MSNVPFDIYKFSNIVHPGACERKVVCGNSCPCPSFSSSAVLSVAGVGRIVVVVVIVRVAARCSWSRTLATAGRNSCEDCVLMNVDWSLLLPGRSEKIRDQMWIEEAPKNIRRASLREMVLLNISQSKRNVLEGRPRCTHK